MFEGISINTDIQNEFFIFSGKPSVCVPSTTNHHNILFLCDFIIFPVEHCHVLLTLCGLCNVDFTLQGYVFISGLWLRWFMVRASHLNHYVTTTNMLVDIKIYYRNAAHTLGLI